MKLPSVEIHCERRGLPPQVTVIGVGTTFQISFTYSIAQRSLENLPMPAEFRIDIRVQRSGSRQSWPTRSWHAT